MDPPVRCHGHDVVNCVECAFLQREQIGQHELMVCRYERELSELRKNPPDRTVQARQLQDFCKLESYVKFEVKIRRRHTHHHHYHHQWN